MASTIKIKRSNVAGKQPNTSTLSVGELAINYKDKKLYSSNGTAIFEIGAGGSTSQYLQVANAAASYAPISNPSFIGVTSTPLLSVTQSSGDEGGQIDFALAATNTTLNGGVAIDIYQNKLRIFETGGSNRGAYIDLSTATNGVGSNLLAGGGSVNLSPYLQVANAVATYATKAYAAANSYVKSILANTNSYIATKTDTTTFNSALANTNAFIKSQLANTNAYIEIGRASCRERVSSPV